MISENQKHILSELTIISKSGIYDGLLRPIAYAISFLTSIVLARTVGASAIGAIGVGLSIMMISQILPGLGLNLTVLRKGGYYLGANDANNVSRLIKLSCISVLVISTSIVFSYFIILRKIAYPLLVRSVGSINVFDDLILVFPLISLIPILQSSFTVIQKNYKITIFDQIIRNISRLVITIVFLFFFNHIIALLLGTIAGLILSSCALAIILTKELKKLNERLPVPVEEEHGIEMGDLLRYSAPLTIVPFLTTASRELDLWVVGYMSSSREAGVYAIVRILGSVILIPLIVFGELFAVSIAKFIRQKNKDGVDKVFSISAKWIGLISGIGFVIIFCLSEDMLRIFGPDFAIGSYALKIFAFAQLYQTIFGASGTILLMYDKRKLLIINGILMLTLNLGLSIYMTSLWGMIGAAISVAVTYVIIQSIVLGEVVWLLKVKPGSIRDYAKRLLIMFITGATIMFLSLVLRHALLLIKLGLSILLGIVVYFIATFLLEKWTQEEKTLLANIAANTKSRLFGKLQKALE
ncbi:MAG: oligosaccharide flippase family protein [Candidatus Aminicenantales bacterium]